MWGHLIWFRQVAYSGVLLLWLGFRVGLKVGIKGGFAIVVGIRSGFEVGIGGGFEVGRFLSFP